MIYPIITGIFWFLFRTIKDKLKKDKVKMLIISEAIILILSLGLYLPDKSSSSNVSNKRLKADLSSVVLCLSLLLIHI
jgi:hypothetical protein